MKSATRYITVAFFLISAWLLWIWLLLSDKIGWIHTPETSNRNPFSVSGSFGDSFGPIGALMATIAAAGFYQAFIRDSEDRKLQKFESNFFTLLNTFESITQQSYMNIGRSKKAKDFKTTYEPLARLANREVTREFHGRRALRIILFSLRSTIRPSGYNNIKVVEKRYNEMYDKWVDTLGHYFRTLYHIFRLIDSCPGDKMYYARIVRASLSQNELCLLAYNCIVGEGRYKFKIFAERYVLFHNIHIHRLNEYEAAELKFFVNKLKPETFRFEKQREVTFDD